MTDLTILYLALASSDTLKKTKTSKIDSSAGGAYSVLLDPSAERAPTGFLTPSYYTNIDKVNNTHEFFLAPTITKTWFAPLITVACYVRGARTYQKF